MNSPGVDRGAIIDDPQPIHGQIAELLRRQGARPIGADHAVQSVSAALDKEGIGPARSDGRLNRRVGEERAGRDEQLDQRELQCAL